MSARDCAFPVKQGVDLSVSDLQEPGLVRAESLGLTKAVDWQGNLQCEPLRPEESPPFRHTSMLWLPA